MPIDQQTDRFKLDLPNEANTLKHDVARLIDSFNTLDEKAAKLDDDGHVSLDQLPDTIAKLTGAGFIKDEQIPTKVPLMDAQGKLSISNIPEQALMTVFDAPSEVMMLELDPAPTIGDVCNITTTPFKQYLLVKADPKNRDSWRELPARAVTSVNGQTGDITVAEAGVNNDITSLTALSGPLKLGGEAAAPFDAVTLRQLQAASGGAGGASMSGVMNNFIGAVEWFMGTRAKLPAGYIQADGQLVLRSAVPDIVAAMSSGMLNIVDPSGQNNSDAMWQMTPTARGRYSWGDGDATTGTTIRMPDLNGVWVHPTNSALNSIPGLFLRGDGMIGKGTGGNETGGIGVIRPSAAPNIKGTTSPTYPNISIWDAAIEAMYLNGTTTTNVANWTGIQQSGVPARSPLLSFDASRSSPVYGANGATEVRPASVQGIWIIRASGSFSSANTNFEVINSYNPMPDIGKAINGGMVQSSIKDEKGQTVNAAGLTVNNTVGKNPSAIVGIANWVKDPTSQQFYLSWVHMDLDWESKMLTTPGGFIAQHDPNCSFNTFVGDPSFKANQLVVGSTYKWYQDAWQFGLRRGGSFDGKEMLIYYNGGATGGSAAKEWTFTTKGDMTGQGYIHLSGAQTTPSNFKEAARLVTHLNNDSANRTFGFGLTQPPNGSTYGQLYYSDSGKGCSWNFIENGSAQCSQPGATWNTGSDERIKRDIECVPNALEAVCGWRGARWFYRGYDDSKFGFGFVAQDIEAVDPRLVDNTGHVELPDGTIIDDCRALSAGNIAAAYHTEAIKELKAMIDALQAEVADLKAKA
ncbi:tail fiber domain-containing protein [Salmonella enterica]|nr:tail fiber domain-containing protein [Salmonella enterica]